MALNFFTSLKDQTITQLDDYITSFDSKRPISDRKDKLLSPLSHYIHHANTPTPAPSHTADISFKQFLELSVLQSTLSNAKVQPRVSHA